MSKPRRSTAVVYCGAFLVLAVWLGTGCESKLATTDMKSSGQTPQDMAVSGIKLTGKLPPSAQVVLADSSDHLAGPTLTTVKLSAIKDLYVRVVAPATKSIVKLQCTFFTPKGELFLDRSFFLSLNPAVRTYQEAPGIVVDVWPATAVQNGMALDVMIPIAGSTFDRYGVPGNWTATFDVTVAGTPLIAGSQTFKLDVTR